MPVGEKVRDRRGFLLLAITALVVLVAVVGLMVFARSTTDSEAGQATPSSTAQQQIEGDNVAPLGKSTPSSVRIPKINAQSTLVGLGLNPDNTVQVPPVSQPLQAGWYSYGPTPGEKGPAVILGHVDGDKQKGIFFRLKELSPGDQIEVSRADGSIAKFVVRKVDQVDKDSFPTNAVYGNTAKPELRLITCGGTFDHAAHSYRDNIIVYADLV